MFYEDNAIVVDISAYQPTTVKETAELRSLAEVEAEGLEALFGDIQRVLDNAFISTLDAEGCLRWERILGVSSEGESLDERRFRIRVAINGDAPYTLRAVTEKLTTLCGADRFTLEYGTSAYTLVVRLNLGVKSKLNSVKAFLDRAIPCNISVDTGLLYNTHETLSVFTHGALSAYTHAELREEVLS